MTIRWEQRVRAALVTQPEVPITVRLAGGLLVGRTRLRRWTGRLIVVLTATTVIALMAAPAIVVVTLLLRAL